MSDLRQAHEVFPWAGIDRAVTVSGLLDHRRTVFRREWGRVLAGTDEDLAEAMLSLVSFSLHTFGLTGEMIRPFMRAEVHRGSIEDVIGDLRAGHPLIERAKAFRAGWLAARA